VNESSLPAILGKLPEEKGKLLLEATLRQLSKDLDMPPEQLDGIEKNQLAELEQIVSLHLHDYTAGKKSVLQQLLYKADISEREYRRILNATEGSDMESRLATAFIFRAFTKCYTRILAAEGKL
jgi:hypothetical protein